MRRTTPQGPATSLGILALGGLALLFSAKGDLPGPRATSTVLTTPAPTPDRLLEPTVPPQPSAADTGAQVFWLYCMPCHGDRGQGLTAEFRQLYPTEEQNCWASGCHGERPYEGGFTLPDHIPALIGEGALQRFETVDALDGFIRAAMPRQAPGNLSRTQYDQVIAFLLRANSRPRASSGQGPSAIPSATPTPGRPTSTPTPTAAVRAREAPGGKVPGLALMAIGIGAAVTVVMFLRQRRRPAAR